MAIASRPKPSAMEKAAQPLKMKTWLRWFLLALSVGGGFTGVVLNFQMYFQPQFKQPIALVLISVSTALYAFVFVSGLIFADNPDRTSPLQVSLSLQVISISSPILAYHFSSGFPVIVSIIDGQFRAAARLGSEWQFNLLQKLPWGVGINLCALTLLVLLVRHRRQEANCSLPAKQPQLNPNDMTA